MQWRIGLMVLVSLAILLIMIMFSGRKSVFNLKRLWKPNYLVAMSFRKRPA